MPTAAEFWFGVGGLFVTIVTGIIAGVWHLSNKINDGDDRVSQAAKTEHTSLRSEMAAALAEIHNRVSRVRDDYVRRDDLDGHLDRIEGSTNEIKEMVGRLDTTTRQANDGFRDRLSALEAAVQIRIAPGFTGPKRGGD